MPLIKDSSKESSSENKKNRFHNMKSTIQVDKTYKNEKRKYTYKDLEYDIDKFADANKYLPADFDLCLLKTKTKTLYGWYSGFSWDGKRSNEIDEVLYWKLHNRIDHEITR